MRSTDDLSIPGAPWWVQAIYKLGFVVTLAGVLLYFVIMTVNSKLDMNLANLRSNQEEHQSMGFYLRAICWNISKPEDRPNCFPTAADRIK